MNGNLALTTTQIAPINVNYGDRTPPLYADPASAYASGLFSTGIIMVHPGDLITIADLYPPSGIGEVAVLQVVPEPTAMFLLGGGLFGLITWRRYSASLT